MAIPKELALDKEQIEEMLLTQWNMRIATLEPATRTLFVYRSARDVRALGEEDELAGEDVVPGSCCPMRRVFA